MRIRCPGTAACWGSRYDRIRLRRGQVVESGAHDELLAAGGPCSRMSRRQLGVDWLGAWSLIAGANAWLLEAG